MLCVLWGTSDEYPQHMFSWRNKKNIIWCYILGHIEYLYTNGWDKIEYSKDDIIWYVPVQFE